MIPKGKVLALLMIFTAVGGVAATGAFTTVQAEREASVSTAGDGAALLQITKADGSQFAEAGGSNGELTINLANSDGDGLNLDSQTLEDGVIDITNNGNDDIVITATADTVDSTTAEFYVEDDELTEDSNIASEASLDQEVSSETVPNGGTRQAIASNGISLGSGDSVTIGLYVSVGDNSQDNIFAADDPVTITADATNSSTVTATS